jgi:hypothetical protein
MAKNVSNKQSFTNRSPARQMWGRNLTQAPTNKGHSGLEFRLQAVWCMCFFSLPPEGGTPNGAGSGCTPIATGADNDVEMDGEPVKNGDMDSRGRPALPTDKVNLCQYS